MSESKDNIFTKLYPLLDAVDRILVGLERFGDLSPDAVQAKRIVSEFRNYGLPSCLHCIIVDVSEAWAAEHGHLYAEGPTEDPRFDGMDKNDRMRVLMGLHAAGFVGQCAASVESDAGMDAAIDAALKHMRTVQHHIRRQVKEAQMDEAAKAADPSGAFRHAGNPEARN